MKARYLFISLILGLGLAVGLLALLTGRPASAEVAAGSVSDLDIAAPSAWREVCPSGCTYSTIQAAVDAANPGETIRVAQGTYTDVHARNGVTQVVYISKTVTILGGYTAPGFASPADPDANATILDAGGQGRVIFITGDISPTIEGLRLTGGDASGLGGHPIAGYDGVGGGIYIYTATATISNCEIHSNVAGSSSWSAGGGVYVLRSAAVLANNEIHDNVASTGTDAGLAGEGGGVSISEGDATLTGNSIHDNVASTIDEGIGGGVYLEASNASLHDNVVFANAASQVSYGQGGGLYLGPFGDPTLINMAVFSNSGGTTANSWGAGIAAEWSDAQMIHTTVANNSGGVSNGVYATRSHIVMTNSIVADHTAVGITVTSNSSAIVNGVLWSSNGTNIDGAGPFTVTGEYAGSPSFDPDGYHLTNDSDAIDRGVGAGVATDVDGHLRNMPDLGADEWRGEVTVGSGTGGTINHINGQGLTTTIKVAPGTVTETVVMQFTPLLSSSLPVSPGLQYSAIAFDLDAFCDSSDSYSYFIYLPLAMRSYSVSSRIVPGDGAASILGCDVRSAADSAGSSPCSPAFQKPVTITIYYSDADIAGLNESTLRLYYWTGSYWQDAATTCMPTSIYNRDPLANMLQVSICHFSRYGMR